MNKVDPKDYTRQTILTGGKERVTKVLARYWKLTHKNKSGDSKTFLYAQKLFA